MKRLCCLLLAACVMLSLCACEKGREKDAGNDASSSNEELSASTEIIPTPNEQETPGKSKPSQPSAGKVDVDLTVLSSTMVYSEVYNMLYNDPAHYLGKTAFYSLTRCPTPASFQTPPPAVPRAWSLCWKAITPTQTIIQSWGRRSPSSVNFSPMKKTG